MNHLNERNNGNSIKPCIGVSIGWYFGRMISLKAFEFPTLCVCYLRKWHDDDSFVKNLEKEKRKLVVVQMAINFYTLSTFVTNVTNRRRSWAYISVCDIAWLSARRINYFSTCAIVHVRVYDYVTRLLVNLMHVCKFVKSAFHFERVSYQLMYLLR